MDKGMSPENDLITVQTSKEITNLYKTFLQILEDVKNNNEILLKKVEEKTSPDFARQINFFTPEYYNQLRKRILDNGNDTERYLLNFLDYFDFSINQVKVKEAASHRKVVKKFVTSMPLDIK
jgi:hypothetical protein